MSDDSIHGHNELNTRPCNPLKINFVAKSCITLKVFVMKNEKQFSKLLCTALFTLFPFMTGHTQSREAFSFNSTINPSTETFAIAQYGKLTPSLYTGAMSFSFPVFTYEDPDFTIPISLDYSFSGYKPAVHSGTVGYGWALNCGGSITREVIGLPDDAQACETMGGGFARAIQSGIFNSETDITNSKQIYLEEHIGDVQELSNVNVFSDCPNYNWKHLKGAGYDTCPDIFHFNFLGYTGEFMLTKEGSIKVFNTNHPHGEFIVEYDFPYAEPSSNSFSEIRIKTGDGYCYYFGGSMQNVEFSKSSGGSAYCISAWKLRKLTAPNGNTIEFEYDILQADYSIFESYTPFISASVQELTNIFGNKARSYTIPYINSSFHYLISKIKLNDSELITFNYSDKDAYENKEDDFNSQLQTWSPDTDQNAYDEKCLSSIVVKNTSRNTVEEVKLEHIYTSENNAAPRMFLSKVSSKQSGSHSFEYNNVSSNTHLPKNDTYASDYWGYWNGNSNALSLKNYIINPSGNSIVIDLYSQLRNSSVKNANSSYSSRGGLSKIIYPTGGHSEIIYESHSVDEIISSPNNYDENHSHFTPGGVRVSKIINTSAEIVDSTRYEYYGGILTHMPRYAMKLEYNYTTRMNDPNSPGETPVYTAAITAIGYTDDCSGSHLRDPHVTYSSAKAIYQDGSSSIFYYHDVSDMPDWKEFCDNVNNTYSNVVCHNKDCYFSTEDALSHNRGVDYEIDVKDIILPNTDDFSRFRGKTKAIHEYDSEGKSIKSVTYDYGNNTNSLVHNQTMVYNTLLDFTEAPLRIYAPILKSETHTTVYDNGESVETLTYSYNDSGQRTGVSRWVDGRSMESQSTRYYPESHPNYDGDTLKTAVSDIVNLKRNNAGESVVSGVIRYHYNDTSNPQPSSIEYFSSENPAISGTNEFIVPEGYVPQTVTYSYHPESKRLILEEFPGNRYFRYTWDSTGRNILSKKSNSDDNITKYSWFDMVGLYDITYPTESKTEWGYDNHNRISDQYDTNGVTQKQYRYHLLNP